MRRRAAFAGILVAAQLAAACWGATFDVGMTQSPPDADVDAGASDAPRDALDGGDAQDAPLSAFGNCGTSGKVDRYFTAKELTDRLVGWWAECPGVKVSPLPCTPSTRVWGIRFDRDGTYALLGADTEFGPFSEQPEACGRGAFRIYSPAPSDGGDAGSSQYVSMEDTTPRNGLEVHLFSDAVPLDVELVEFEVDPRRLFLREQGQAGGSAGYLAPIPPTLR